MQSGSAGMGFTEDIGEVIVVHQDTSHVNQSIVRGGFVKEKELVDLSIIHLGEMGQGCCIDKLNLWSNKQGQSRWRIGWEQSQSWCIWWCQGVSLQQRMELDTAQYPVNQQIVVGEPCYKFILIF